MIDRRGLLGDGAVAALAPPAATAAARAQGQAQRPRVPRFVPQSDLAALDPRWTAAWVTRNHGFMVLDALHGQDGRRAMSPQMVAGHTASADDLLRTVGLRDGLLFHDNTPVPARDRAQSIRRRGKRDGFGQALMAATGETAAPDDGTVTFRPKRPFPLLPSARGETGGMMCPIMPERPARTDPFRQVIEMVGSGPYRLTAKGRVPGSLVVRERFGRLLAPTGRRGDIRDVPLGLALFRGAGRV